MLYSMVRRDTLMASWEEGMKLHEMQVPFATSIPYLSCLVIAERSYSICILHFLSLFSTVTFS